MTNYDGLVVSALVQAQSETTTMRKAGPCPLRGMRTSPIVQGSGARLAAAVSLVLASAKINDHVADRDGVFGRRGVSGVAQRVAGRWAKQGALTGSSIDFDTAVLLDAVAAQPAVEASLGLGGSLLTATEPTETATAAAFAHTAVLSGRPQNVPALSEAGRLFGRIAHLVDAVEDLEDDRASGAWNPLLATGTSLEETRRLCDDAVLGVRLALREAEFVDDKLIHALLAHELDHAIQRAFGDVHGHPTSEKTEKEERRDKRYSERKLPRSWGAACGVAMFMFCTCQYCCADPYHDPWTGEPKPGWCHRCDCDCCDCSCCDCDGCCCDGCGCDC
ncbi:hypothetical protein JOF56_004900 [Kibdelosporangium banguiense]|uniref:Uncharacterized protein n=1 Tax=Kibdelosporangium banguiense TaxID=1365924 RepID=A0ABS4TKH3_9PSEU|nr:hypothetical protein [Kibdelosporangium banguiense]